MTEQPAEAGAPATPQRSAYALAELLKRLPAGGWVAQEAAQLLVAQNAMIEALELQLREPQA